MLLWNVIRDFFVNYIFGGVNSTGNRIELWIGDIINYEERFGGYLTDLFYPVSVYPMEDGSTIAYYLDLSNWLSTTATIITLCALVIGISALMISLFKWIVRLVSLRG